MHIKSSILFLIGCWLLLSPVTQADTPPPWKEFEIKSANGEYIAQLKKVDNNETVEPCQRKYKLNVYKSEGGLQKPLWSCDYNYDGYPGGMLSDDGTTFVYIDFWYTQERPLVTIYRDGAKTIELGAQQFTIDPSRLQATVSHVRWLQDGVPRQFLARENQPLALEINTIDGGKHVINLETGRVTF